MGDYKTAQTLAKKENMATQKEINANADKMRGLQTENTALKAQVTNLEEAKMNLEKEMMKSSFIWDAKLSVAAAGKDGEKELKEQGICCDCYKCTELPEFEPVEQRAKSNWLKEGFKKLFRLNKKQPTAGWLLFNKN